MDVIIKPGVTGTGITPQQPIEPPAEVKAMTFNLDENLFSGGDGSTIKTDNGTELKVEAPEKKEEKVAEVTPVAKESVEKKEVVTEKKEEKKEEKKSVLKAPKEEPKKEEVKPEEKKEAVAAENKEEKAVATEKKEVSKLITPKSPAEKKEASDTFDYTGFAPQEVTNLKNMSRQSRDWAAALVKQNKELSSLKDSTYLQHEGAYVLSPDYKQLQQRQYLAVTEGRAWEQALLNIRGGKKFRDITGFDNRGQPIMSEERDPSDADEIRVSSNLNACIQANNALSGQLQEFPTQYRNRLQTDLQAIQQERNSRFAWAQDPKLLEYSVEMEGGQEKKIKDIISDFTSIWPPYLQNSPGVKVAADMMVALVIRSAELREALNGQQVEKIKKEEAVRGEPTSEAAPTEITGETKVNGHAVPKSFSLDGFLTR